MTTRYYFFLDSLFARNLRREKNTAAGRWELCNGTESCPQQTTWLYAGECQTGGVAVLVILFLKGALTLSLLYRFFI